MMGHNKYGGRLMAIMMSGVVLVTGVGGLVNLQAAETNTQQVIDTASDRAYEWLKTMQDSTYEQKLVDSFEDYDSSGVAYPISYTYDQACAAIAFHLKGDTERATRILDILADLQVPQTVLR